MSGDHAVRTASPHASCVTDGLPRDRRGSAAGRDVSHMGQPMECERGEGGGAKHQPLKIRTGAAFWHSRQSVDNAHALVSEYNDNRSD
ncbi:hypothetical protein EYF80_010264 [Liparis tanakae]|uniref:Uncharacterized protein n=1 Tax=Liparis tanakae TaxID=230148 RepID=A0A4Z2IN21_9TELE|nr:hypothetical protein EYF80_010264 [Liparis tanakae]